jgi:hypothetical protein
MTNEESDDVRIATITITRDLTVDHDVIRVEAVDASDEDLPLVEALGLLRFAEDSVIRDRMGEAPNE